MAKLLTFEEMVQCAREIGSSDDQVMRLADNAAHAIEKVGTELAMAIASKLGVRAGYANYDLEAFCGTCAPFYALYEGQPCPNPLSKFDETEWGTLEQGHLKPDAS